MSANFVSLHNHTEYSFLDSTIRVRDLVRAAKEFDMPAVAITDHGGLFGAAEFYETCVKEGVKPILGFEAYIASGLLFNKAADAARHSHDHIILLAENNTGWKNLMRLSSIGYSYLKPLIDMRVLRQYSEGIIATSACVAGAIPQAIIDGDMDRARKIAEEYISIFGKDNFFFELHDHGFDEEKIVMPKLIELGREMGVPFIAANDAHYLRREDARCHEVLLRIGADSKLSDPERFRSSSDQYYFKSPEEMAALFPDVPEAMENTVKIAERCNVDIIKKPSLPAVPVPEGIENDADYLTRLAIDGIKERYPEAIIPELSSENKTTSQSSPAPVSTSSQPSSEELPARLNHELEIINNNGFARYFLIVRDIVNFAKEKGIAVGCRGAAAGSLVAYSIGITDIDPIKYDLVFERFINPERMSMPDIDIDFADRDKQVVIDYVIDKYGRDAVCHIINFGKMKGNAVVKDVAHVMGVPTDVLDDMLDAVSYNPWCPLKYSIDDNDELKAKINGNELYREVFKHAVALEGLTRRPGMHAGGIVIAPSAVTDYAPLFRTVDKDGNEQMVMTQFDMNYIEKVGLVKMDILGLRVLTILQESLRLIKENHGKTLDLWKLPTDDEKTFELFGAGETTGIFQFESNGLKEYLRELKPSDIEDIIALIAMYRPGPMDNIDSFINRKHGREEIKYQHPILGDILDVTYGILIYQEQVMRIAQAVGGFTLIEADKLRKAMGKKQADVTEKMRIKFIDGAAAQGIDKNIASEIFDLMAKFGCYGFNKAHAAVYAHLSYQSAYLKAHYPHEYITAYLCAYSDDEDEREKMRGEARRLGIGEGGDGNGGELRK